jgi:arginine/ornithine succinyltransferase subunit-like protein
VYAVSRPGLSAQPQWSAALQGALFIYRRLREWFSPHLFAELRGCSDEQGQSPFWDALGHHFDIPFADADRLTGTGMKTFIAELMPAYPIYISLLPEAAREVIGQVHPNTAPARAILEKEGFSWRGSVDIFDAGPVLEANTDQIRAVRDSQCLPAQQLMAPAGADARRQRSVRQFPGAAGGPRRAGLT